MANNSLEYQRLHYKDYRGKPDQIKKRSSRNSARRKKGLKKGSKTEVDHKNGNALQNGKSNLRVLSRKKNRQLGAAKANKKKGKGYKKRPTIKTGKSLYI